MNNKLKPYLVSPKSTVREAIHIIDQNREGIALVVDDMGRLIGTITDGDIRRFMLANRSLDETCANVMWINPLTVPMGTSNKTLVGQMRKHSVRSIPLVDETGAPCDIVHLRDLIPASPNGQIAVVMAGGEGKRLRPLTNNIPKPMVKVGDRPILAKILEGLAEHGIRDIYLTVNYQANMIEDYFKDGSDFGVKLTYLREPKKMGTAGGLSLMENVPVDAFVVMNGDVITSVNFTRILDFHRQHRAVLSVAATEYHITVPYGVLNLANHYVLGIREKPTHQLFCNAGIYVVNPELLRFIPGDKAYHMTDLAHDVIREGLPVAAFPIREYWVDIGQKEDLKKARIDANNHVATCEKNSQ